jgi:hypothetical protein
MKKKNVDGRKSSLGILCEGREKEGWKLTKV